MLRAGLRRRCGFRRIYPDLPGMGRTVASEGLRSAEDVLDTLLDFAGEVTDGTAHLLIGGSLGWRLLRTGDGYEEAGAGRWSRAGLSAAAGPARRTRAPRRCRVG